MLPSNPNWHPTTFVQFDRVMASSMDTARIITDAGPAFIKAMGNRQGPHQLAAELVGTKLASWLGLPTFDFDVLSIDSTTDVIPHAKQGFAASGPAFVTRAITGRSWNGTDGELKHLLNPEDIAKLVVFDTWTVNADRCPPDLNTRKLNLDNVFLEEVARSKKAKTVDLRLIAMDHSHCFTSGTSLGRKLTFIRSIKDERLYGLFPEFQPYMTQTLVEVAIERLGEFSRDDADAIIADVPKEWELSLQARQALAEFLCQRGRFLVDTLTERIGKLCWPGILFDKR
jgi:hypothetical protein